MALLFRQDEFNQLGDLPQILINDIKKNLMDRDEPLPFKEKGGILRMFAEAKNIQQSRFVHVDCLFEPKNDSEFNVWVIGICVYDHEQEMDKAEKYYLKLMQTGKLKEHLEKIYIKQ